ncbi:hypothetical protein WME79_08380 [Sorangium sp. So ce726]
MTSRFPSLERAMPEARAVPRLADDDIGGERGDVVRGLGRT